MDKLTKELKKKFFDLYNDQFVLGFCNKSPDKTRVVDSSDSLRFGSYLKLKPISLINEYEAIDIVELTLRSEGMSDMSIISKIAANVETSALLSKRDMAYIQSSVTYGEYTESSNLFLYASALKAVQADYLRSKGYAVGFIGYSVEELAKEGWIKLELQKPFAIQRNNTNTNE